MATYLPSRKPFKLDQQDLRYSSEEVRMNSQAMFSYGPLHTEEQVLDGQLELIYNSSVWTQDVV